MVAYNELLDRTQGYVEGRDSLADVTAALAAADEALGQLRFEFQEGLRFQESGPEMERSILLVGAMFGLLQRTFDHFEAALKEGDHYDAAIALQEGNAAVNQIFEELADLREALDTVGYSESPFVNEILRVGYAYLGERLPLEVFQERVVAFWDFHREFVADFQASQPATPEDSAYEELRLDIEEALDQQTRGLEDLLAACESGGEGGHLESALVRIQLATQALVSAQKELRDRAHLAEFKSCPRCGRDNPLSARFCAGCAARFPEAGGELRVATIEMLSHSETEGDGNLHRLHVAADSFKRHECGMDQFLLEADRYSGIVRKVMSRFEALPEVARSSMGEQQWEAYSAMRGIMKGGLADMKAGLRALAEFVEGGELAALDEALHGFERGEQELARLEEIPVPSRS